MKAVTVILIAADERDVISINAHLEESGLLNEWPVFAWGENDATPEQEQWFSDEYQDKEGES